jgi:succinate dehydrogenase/fumarate reductase flavoprotein subunit
MIPVYRTKALVVGSGAASLSCAVHLKRMGVHDMVIVTDNSKGGTSRNTGSDKQTYYRLSDASPIPDSPYSMVESYTRGGSVHGDMAFVEAQNSLRAFYNLVSLGVNFPSNRYGGYTGYKTDHDPSNRGISLGPYTSKEMVRVLHAEVEKCNIPLWDRCDVVRLITDENHAMVGAVVLNKQEVHNENHGLCVILSEHVVLGTGGPAGFYAASVYPRVHVGSIGLAMEIGAEAVNLTESQFGIASTKFRWNLSGSYQQVLPRYISTDRRGNNPVDFLLPYFNNWEELTNAVFLKGYQWPFDAAKIFDQGSSLIDLLVYHETQVKGRRVFLDYSSNIVGNPAWSPFSRHCVHPTALGYLDASKAWAETPFERLKLLNTAAVDLYAKHGIDLQHELLEIDVCAQHNNGGLYSDIWWESTNIKGLYPIGEVNGSHGVSRPGGSALNAGQVGALRAAQRIAASRDSLHDVLLSEPIQSQLKELVGTVSSWVASPKHDSLQSAKYLLDEQLSTLQRRMSNFAGPIRRKELVQKALLEAKAQQLAFGKDLSVPVELLAKALRLRHMLIAQVWYLSAIDHYIQQEGGSRGSYLVVDSAGREAHPLAGQYRIKEEKVQLRSVMQVLYLDAQKKLCHRFDQCRAVPSESFWFEQVWKEYQSGLHLL